MDYIFSKSVELAQADFTPNALTRCQVFSYAWYKGRVIAMGRNSAKTHPVNLRNPLTFSDGKIHSEKGSCAEWGLCRKLVSRTNIPFDKIKVVNVRLDKARNVKNSRPCSSCSGLFRFFAPKEVWFSNNFGEFERYS